MAAAPPLKPGSHPDPGCLVDSPAGTILLAIALGLCGGYLDLVVMIVMKYCWNDLRYFWSGSDFPWSVPIAHAFLLGLAGTLVALVKRIVPWRLITLRAAAWLFTTLALWSALLRMPLYGICTLLLAAGLGWRISTAIATFSRGRRRARFALAGLLGLLAVLAACSSGVRAVRTYRAKADLPAPAQGARNVVLIVWDTVRAPNSSLYGYHRDTTPNLQRWAQTGARYGMAIAPAPWTYPSHSSFFTGQWPYQLNTQWNSCLDTTYPTLAEYLASRGYQTAGFAANTQCCSYETGLDRGFVDYEDYPLTPASLLGRTSPGNWICTNILNHGDFYASKWISLQSRDAIAINDAFLGWLNRRPPDRPFFAFLNYHDAHNPYVPPAKYAGRFGIQPRGRKDYGFLLDFRMNLNDPNWDRNMTMARDCYDDCIAFLDDQLERLMSELRRQGLLSNTLVIVTGDHGESFGDHHVFSHGTGLYTDQVAVPLVILSPDAPAGLNVPTPVSLRDLPATVIDQVGLSAGSPFPGHSLAAFWRSAPGQASPKISPALSELVKTRSTAFENRGEPDSSRLQMSLMAPGWHYIRDGAGAEQIYDLSRDAAELDNLAAPPAGKNELGILPFMPLDTLTEKLGSFRRVLLDTLTDDRGTPEVENAYLKPYRQRLKSLVQASSPSSESTTAAVRPP